MVVVQWIYGKGDDDRVLVYGKLTQKSQNEKLGSNFFQEKQITLRLKNLKSQTWISSWLKYFWSNGDTQSWHRTVPLTPKNM